jgi:predicted phosphodiesterase
MTYHSVQGKHRVLILSDLHLPYHDPTAVKKALAIGKLFRPDIIILNGDFLDAISLSRYSRRLEDRDFNREVKAARTFLYGLRKEYPLAKMFYRTGNHEKRVADYLMNTASELSTLEELQLPHLLHLKELRIQWLEREDILDLCGLKVLHGHEVSGTLSVYPARGLQLATQCPSICGHSHRSSFYISRNIERKIIQSWTLGCLCDLQPSYSINNNWVHGVGLVETIGQNKFKVILENF